MTLVKRQRNRQDGLHHTSDSPGARMRVREGAAIRRRRLQQGLSQRELAFLARPCSQTTIYLLENQHMTTLTDQLAQRIARRLDVPVNLLFEGTNTSDSATSIQLPEVRTRA